jgi:hypothetical protein
LNAASQARTRGSFRATPGFSLIRTRCTNIGALRVSR